MQYKNNIIMFKLTHYLQTIISSKDSQNQKSLQVKGKAQIQPRMTFDPSNGTAITTDMTV